MPTDTERLSALENAVQHLSDSIWRLQGRINALETVALTSIMDRAKIDANPPQWIQTYVANMKITLATLLPDVEDQSKANRLLSETRLALEEALEQLLIHSGKDPMTRG